MSNQTNSSRTIALAVLIAASTAIVSPMTALAQTAQAPLQVSYPTDASMTCEQMVFEIANMDQIAGVSTQNAQNAQNEGAMADSATSVAVSAALYSGALGRVPGLGMFANAAGAAARRNAEARARQEQERIAVAQQRRTLLSGIYQGRNCAAQAQAQVPAVQPVAPDALPPPVQ